MTHNEDNQMQPRSFRPTILAIALSTVACGPTVEVERASPILPDEAAPPLAECSAPLLVPEGAVWLGPIGFEHGILQKNSCENGVGTTRFTVGDVFLDADEVTNGCYRHCVDAGACLAPNSLNDPDAPDWTDPTITDFTAVLDEERAEAFCAFRGGRLASIAELARAMQADALSVAQPEIFKAWESCFAEDFASSECTALRTHAHVPGDGPLRPMQAIRSEPRDIGPFGHYDLFGSQAEVSATKFPPIAYPKEWCNDGAFAPITYSTQADASRIYHLPGVLIGDSYLTAASGANNFFTFTMYGLPSPSLGGARCAYDVIP
jgi:formylglycine-generating enzyme required for sulfatase activity